MARKTTKPPEEPPPPAGLTGSRAEAEAKLTARIEKADALRQKLGPAGSEPGPSAEEEYRAWNSYNCALLERMFTDRTIAQEYDDAGPPARVLDLGGEAWLGGPRTRRVDPEIPEKLAAKVAKLRSIREQLEVFAEPEPAADAGAVGAAPEAASFRRAAFIVHGHDEGALEATARVLQQLGIEPIILHEQANQGRTILEKIEAHADVPFAVVLLTPDDVGGKAGEEPRPRARQNVVLELGFFWGKLGRSKVCVLYKQGVELPSDLGGLVYVAMDDAGAWRFALAKEMNEAGISVDLNRLLRR